MRSQEVFEGLLGIILHLNSAEQLVSTRVGLALVQRNNQKHGGRIWGDTIVDRGGLFSFSPCTERSP
jgi:light-regulated signal transduction histidine kinase (bacteriophytochrome)